MGVLILVDEPKLSQLHSVSIRNGCHAVLCVRVGARTCMKNYLFWSLPIRSIDSRKVKNTLLSMCSCLTDHNSVIEWVCGCVCDSMTMSTVGHGTNCAFDPCFFFSCVIHFNAKKHHLMCFLWRTHKYVVSHPLYYHGKNNIWQIRKTQSKAENEGNIQTFLISHSSVNSGGI